MSNQLQKIDQLPLTEIMSLAKAFAESGMFQDIKSAAQAVVKIQAGQEIGIPPFMAMSGLHIIKGKTTIGSGIMSAKIKASPKYDYKVIAKTDKICKLEFFEDGKSQGIEDFTLEDARRAETQNMHRHPKNMLFARCISNGQKTYCPDVFLGPVYVPEDFGRDGDAVTEDVNAEVTNAASDTQATPQFEPQPEDLRPELTFFHASYAAVVDAVQNKGYKIEDVERKYRLPDEVRATLAKLVPAAPGQPTTQEMIHANNATYIPPVIPASDAVPKSKRPF